MRIAVNAAFLGGSYAGLPTYADSLIKHLPATGDEVLLYTSDGAGAGGARNVQKRGTWRLLRSAGGRPANVLRMVGWSQTVLPLRLLRDRPHVLLSPVPEGMLMPVCPQVVVVHDLIPLLFPGAHKMQKHYFRHVLPRLLDKSAGVVAVSEHTKGDLIRHLGITGEKVTVVHNGLSPVYFSDDPGIPPRDFARGPYFLFVGRSSPLKNFETVLRAFARIQKDVPHRLLAVAGRNPYQEKLKALSWTLGLDGQVSFCSGLGPRELLFLYRNATALVLLSKYEGFGYPPLEAMAVGTPAIVSDSTSLAEVAGPGAVCVPYADPGPAAEVMLRLARDADYRGSLAEKGKAYAREFTMERAGRQIRDVLEECAHRG